MYYENYGDYMRGQTNPQNMGNPYYTMPTYQQPFVNPVQNPNQLANNLYPKLYQEINQSIDNCANNDYRLTEENVNKITDKIYDEHKAQGHIPECKDQKQTSFIKNLILILVIKHLLSKQRPRSPYQQIPNPMQQPQMPFGYNGYMGY